MDHSDYLAFLRRKIKLASFAGFDIADDEINPILKPHQRACVKWAVRGGYCTPGKARITNVIQSADRPMLTQEVCDAAKVCRTSACRILNTMALLGEARNVGVKTKANWVKA